MKTILVVDDLASVRLYHESLLKRGGYQTLSAGNGADALEVLERSPVDLVMLDLLMPKMNGREFMERVHSNPRFAALPILLITSEAHGRESELTNGRSTCAVLNKPILPNALLEAVNRLVC